MFGSEGDADHVLRTYDQKVEELRRLGEEWNLTREEVDEIFTDAFKFTEDNLAEDSNKRTSNVRNSTKRPFSIIVHSVKFCIKFILWLVLGTSVLYCMIACNNSTKNFLTRFIQGSIHPFMKYLRIVTLPIINAYPSLTDWHEEQCLIKNPLYQIQELDCWPCQQVRSVLDLSGLNNFTESYYHSGIPFIVKDAVVNEVNLTMLEEMYKNNKGVIDKGAPRIVSTLENLQSVSNLFEPSFKSLLQERHDIHVAWKINRIAAARVVREAFPRPYFVPAKTEVAIQRFVYVDGPTARPFDLPMTDFANVWLNQGTGERLIILAPSDECSKVCSPISIVVQPKDVLFYNWQFWRPRSLPVEGSRSLSITFIGSFY